jgi:hypothetical protein
MGSGLDVTSSQRQTRLRTAQGLNLTLLIAAQHQRLVGWIEIESDDVPEFGLKRTLEEIRADILALEKETEGLLSEIVTGSAR